ncbi:hypothetical protein [Alkalihalobacillus hemicellulosilyticus]|nr:hypothetical protein [Halalkalibacter hemicellulosilyticus]
MNQSGKALLGSWLQAVGTIVSALGSTPPPNKQKRLQLTFP